MEWSSATGSSAPSSADAELAALRAGDERAFLALVQRHQRGMVRVASLYVKSAATAEEVVQEAWIGVLRGLDGFQRRSSLRSWIFGILVHCAKARAAREGRTLPFSSLEVDGDEGPSVPPERFLDDGQRWAGHWSEPLAPWPDVWAESREMIALIQEGLATLPEAQRTVMTLRDVDGWGSEEVCELLGISEGNQRVLLHRARSRVRAHVEEQLGKGERA